MRSIVCILIAYIIALVAAAPMQLMLNRASTTAILNIKQITHDPDLRTVTIDLKRQRQCEAPSFVVRISGASLYFLDLDRAEFDVIEPKGRFFSQREAKYQFSYPLLDAGPHFIEVLMLHCARFTPRSFRDLCVERFYGGENVMNVPFAFYVDTPSPSITRPRWILGNQSAHAPWTAELVSTRYQSIPDEQGQFNKATENRSKHERYEFVNLPPLASKLHKVLELSNATDTSQINVCMIGCSHALDLAKAGQGLLLGKKLKFVHVPSRSPWEFNVQMAVDADCGYAIVGYGQWSFGWQSNYTAARYAREMQSVMTKIATYRADGGTVQFFGRSLNYSPPGGRMLLCTPLDFRTPHVTQMANRIFHTAAMNHSVEFIDTSHIMAPLWDSAEDWRHPRGKVFNAEAYWITHAVLASSLSHNAPVVFETRPVVRENDTVRFTGSATVYLYQNHTLRAFLNNATFIKMGHDYDDTKVLVDRKKKYFYVGDDLPTP